MEQNRAVAWLQVIGNAAIVAGLVLVAVQIRQSSDLANADLVSRGSEASTQFYLAMMGEDAAQTYAKAAIEPESLTSAELVVLKNYIAFWWNLHCREEVLSDLGVWDAPEARATFLEWHAKNTYGGNSIARSLWHEWNANEPDWKWTKVVEAAMPDSVSNANAAELQMMLDAAKARLPSSRPALEP